jgi:hypothetical protein
LCSRADDDLADINAGGLLNGECDSASDRRRGHGELVE